jgi:hypothetical protein
MYRNNKSTIGVLIFSAGLMFSAPSAAQAGLPTPFVAPLGEPSCLGSAGYSAAFEGRRTFIWRPQSLRAIKDGQYPQARQVRLQVINAANRALRRAPTSVTDKTKTPSSGDKHDYFSMGPYWWPDSTKPNGEPYVRRDGAVNPERNGEGFDASRLTQFSDDISSLALAYYFSSDARYANKAAAMLRVWFLDPQTRMNPSFAYAQAVPGVSAGRPEGIIDGHRFVPVIESIGLLGPSGALSAAQLQGLETWFGTLAQWMASSENGQAEQAKSNNHGIFYDLLISQYALFARQPDIAIGVINDFATRRIGVQFGTDGRLEEELSRTRSWHYSHWTLAATGKLAGLGECVGLDLWQVTSADGRGLKRSLSFLAGYVARENTWSFPESAFQPGGNLAGAHEIALENFRIAAWGYRDKSYEALANYYGKLQTNSKINYWLGPY